MQKTPAITDLNAPNGSGDIPFQSQEFGQDGHRHFLCLQPHFQLNMTSQTLRLNNEEMKVQETSV